MSASSCAATKSPRLDLAQPAREVEVIDLLEMPGEGYVEAGGSTTTASSPASSTSSRSRGLERVLAGTSQQAGRELDEGAPDRVAVLADRHEHPVLVVDRQHHRGPGVLDHEPARTAPRPAGPGWWSRSARSANGAPPR